MTDHTANVGKMVSDESPDAPWLSEAHALCADMGIPPGNISFRLEVLRGLMNPTCTWTPLDLGRYEACVSIYDVFQCDDGTDALPAYCEDCGGSVVSGAKPE